MPQLTPKSWPQTSLRRLNNYTFIFDIEQLYRLLYRDIGLLATCPPDNRRPPIGWSIDDLVDFWLVHRLYKDEVVLMRHNPEHAISGDRSFPLNMNNYLSPLYQSLLMGIVRLPREVWFEEAVSIDVCPDSLSIHYSKDPILPWI